MIIMFILTEEEGKKWHQTWQWAHKSEWDGSHVCEMYVHRFEFQ